MVEKKIDEKGHDLNYLFLLREPFPPFRPDTVILFADELKRRGHHIDWMFQSKEPVPASYHTTWDGGKAWVTATDRRSSVFGKIHKHLLSLWMDLTIITRAKTRKYDFIQVRDRFFGALTGLVAARLSGCKFYFWLSFPFPEMYAYRIEDGESDFPVLDRFRSVALKVILYKIIMPSADFVFVQSDQMKKDVVANGVDANKILPVPMGISLTKLTEWSKLQLEPVKEDSPVVLYLGTLVRDRKLDFLIRVHGYVMEQVPNAKLYLVGGGQCKEDEQLLLDEATRLGILDSIVFTGFLPMEQAWQFLSRANVCVSPFYPTPILNSTSPTKLVEYMAFGKPVVANNHPDQIQVIENSQAGYCVSWDEKEFADAIIAILNNPEEAGKMGERGRRYVEENRAYHSIAEQLDEVYRGLCQ
ncbi:glycosyltransferase family 4 protein [Ketobacter sp.]|nr:MAG: glycosyltransferase WbuB [Ketobacter sp.]